MSIVSAIQDINTMNETAKHTAIITSRSFYSFKPTNDCKASTVEG